MSEAFIGLLGVIVGALLTGGIEWWRQVRTTRKEMNYLAIHVSSLLERYAAGCAEVVRDDGLYQGQYDEDGCKSVQVDAPVLELYSVDVEWKSLPTKLLYEVLNFPNEIETAKVHVNGASEHAFPPDYEEAYEERQYQYAKLGVSALGLSAKLRANAGLPGKESSDWDSAAYFKSRILEIEALRYKRNERDARLLSDIPG